jgi:hypothetical protein
VNGDIMNCAIGKKGEEVEAYIVVLSPGWDTARAHGLDRPLGLQRPPDVVQDTVMTDLVITFGSVLFGCSFLAYLVFAGVALSRIG